MMSLWIKIRWLGAWIWLAVEQWFARRRNRRIAQGRRRERAKKYVLTVTRPRAGCVCAEVDAAERPCPDCRAQLAQGFLRHDVSFVALGEVEFALLRRTASRGELEQLQSLGLLPTIRQEIVRHERCGAHCDQEGVHVHHADVIDAVPHDHDLDPCTDPECGGLHLRDLVWYEGALCRYTELSGPSPEEDAARVATGEPSPVDPGVCPSCYGELPHHEYIDCPGNQDEKII